jgi:hypothetical protein
VTEDSPPGGRRRELAILRLWEAYNLLDDEEDSVRMLVELALLGLARRRPGAAPAEESDETKEGASRSPLKGEGRPAKPDGKR